MQHELSNSNANGERKVNTQVAGGITKLARAQLSTPAIWRQLEVTISVRNTEKTDCTNG